ncbi:putative uncharacterized protein DDB_G0271982 [Procambarus clarkii]|uniref:putative uncharacterized protein DDB_G0271982 n=1 Tax=Procambarus clarkii TaxID=6728 RepID=UPI0037426286
MDKVQALMELGKPEDLEGCTRDQLKQIAEKCGIRLKASKVAGMKDEILRQLRAKTEVAEPGAQKGAESGKEDDGQDEVEKEKARLEVEKEKEKTRIRELKLEREKEKEKTKQMQIEANRTLAERRIERGLPESTTQVSHSPDVRVREKDIPLFVPEEAESVFEYFEKVASIKEWPQEE